MSESAPLGAPPGVPADRSVDDAADRSVGDAAVAATSSSDEAALVELAGLTAYVRMGLFGLIARQTFGAPSLEAAMRMETVAVRIGNQQQALYAAMAERGNDPVELLRPFTGVLDAFDARTQPSTWWEGVLKAVVGHGVAGDLCRLLATALPDAVGPAVGEALVHADRDQDLRVTQMVQQAAAHDARLASRLALWGRRIVGESLRLSQDLLSSRPALARLARTAAESAAASGAAAPADPIAWVIIELTAEHARRMDWMGLAA